MNYCEECGAKLQEGMKFCGNCGTPVPTGEAVEPLKPENVIQEPLQAAEAAASPKASKMKKGILAAVIIAALLAVIAIVLWQSEMFNQPEKPADTNPVQTVDQDNLYGTLKWKENQDQEYTLKNSLIEGNSDANVKEIFEESAYFTPQKYQYAVNGKQTYYQIACQYEKQEKTIPYVLVFQVNEQEHLELAELYKRDKKIDASKFESFYKKLYKTKAQVAAEEAETVTTEAKNEFAYMEGAVYGRDFDEYGEPLDCVYIESVENDLILVTLAGYGEEMPDLHFYRKDSTIYECHEYEKDIILYIYDRNTIGIDFAEAGEPSYGLQKYIRQ